MPTSEYRTGVVYALACYLWWGLAVLYFKAVDHVPPFELLAHRVIWSFVLVALLLRFRTRVSEALAILRRPRVLATLALSTVLIACNWFTFLWAVLHSQIIQASLGYFINPLVNVFLGFVFLGERLRRVQWAAVSLALGGVVALTVSLGGLPTIALVLAITFGLYGLVRKTAAVDSLVGLSLETLMLLPLSLGYLAWLYAQGENSFGMVDRTTDVLLLLSGLVTALPLLWFGHAARRLPLSTLGVLQYVGPSLQLLIGVALFGEAFTRGHTVAFTFIWSGLALYSWDSLRARRQRLRAMA